MKSILPLSLGVNAALVLTVAILIVKPLPESRAPEEALRPEALIENGEGVAEKAPAPADSPWDAELIEPLTTASRKKRGEVSDLGEMRHEDQIAALVAAGWPREQAESFALGYVMRQLLLQSQNFQGNAEYWQQPAMMDLDWEEQRKMVEIQHRMGEVVEEILGFDPNGWFGGGAVPIPRDKARAAALIQQDYQMMQHKIQQGTGGILLPEDRKAMAMLDEERRRDLEALLTAEELFEYEVRRSPVAMGLRHQLQHMEPTEEEFRTIFAVRREGQQPGYQTEEERRAAAEVRERQNEQLRELLGEDRFRIFERTQDWSYGQLVNVTRRLDLPRETVDEVFAIKERFEGERQTAAGRDLPREERDAARKELAAATEAEVRELLGDDGFDLYRQHGGHWLHNLRH